MKIRLVIITFFIVFLGGCVSSLHPLYSSDTLTFRTEMLGNWVQADGQGQWIFVKNDKPDDLYYTLIFTQYDLKSKEQTQNHYIVHLVKLGNYYFLDFELALSDEEEEKLIGNLFSPVLITHKFAKIDISKEKLKVYMFDDEWISDLFDQQKIRMKHEKLENGSILLTASTNELQKFVKKYAAEKKAFSDELILTRKSI